RAHCESHNFFDFSSAFNTIQALLLKVKLSVKKVDSALVSWITDYLTGRLQYGQLQKWVSVWTDRTEVQRNLANSVVKWCQHKQTKQQEDKRGVVDFWKIRSPLAPVTIHDENTE
ncbi:hypothetical protein P4O66_012670, partial [Electrophorus voltai]